MPMGTSLSSDIYQYKVDGHLEGIDHYVVITDNIIYGYDNDGTDHDKTVRDVMQKVQEVGMHFNPTNANLERQKSNFWV